MRSSSALACSSSLMRLLLFSAAPLRSASSSFLRASSICCWASRSRSAARSAGSCGCCGCCCSLFSSLAMATGLAWRWRRCEGGELLGLPRACRRRLAFARLRLGSAVPSDGLPVSDGLPDLDVAWLLLVIGLRLTCSSPGFCLRLSRLVVLVCRWLRLYRPCFRRLRVFVAFRSSCRRRFWRCRRRACRCRRRCAVDRCRAA